MKRTLLLIQATTPARVEEALRAALGLTLRAASVEVWLPPDRELTILARRAISVLETFGHRVHPGGDRETLTHADAVEVWT